MQGQGEEQGEEPAWLGRAENKRVDCWRAITGAEVGITGREAWVNGTVLEASLQWA